MASYPIGPRPGGAPRWAGGVLPASDDESEIRHASEVAATRTGGVGAAAVTLAPRTWAELTPTSEVRTTLRGSLQHKVIRSPLLPARGASLTACAKGDYRTQWENFGRALAGAGIDSPTLDLGHGQAGATSQPAEFAACYRQVAAAVRGVLPRATLQWTVARGTSNASDPVVAWPGDGVVDIVGIEALDTGDDWSKAVNGTHGLNWWSDFARDRGARVALSGWGLAPGSARSAQNAAYVQNMRDWLGRIAGRGALAYDLYIEPRGAAGGAAANVYRALF